MAEFRVAHDLDECRELWEQSTPRENLADLWEVRDCFQRRFRRPAHFLVAEASGALCGLLPLSWIEEAGAYGYFPGETWANKTWLEQNRIHARDADTLDALMERCPSPRHLRYLLPPPVAAPGPWPVDEIGYLFLPPQYDYDVENYLGEFSGKSAKRLRRDLACFNTNGVSYRYDDLADFDRLVELNIGRFGSHSYYHDPRFREAFRDLMHLLAERGWLRMTAIVIGGETAAIDLGCVYRGTYTLLAGGTHADYCGVAKLINFHHMDRACREHLQRVDFLCGDFSWKTLFHLTPRPLYLLTDMAVPPPASAPAPAGSVARV